MTKYYTGKGDNGTTGILSNRRVSKADKLIESIGDLDELNSAIGVALAHVKDESVAKTLKSIQNELFILGANIASTNDKKVEKAQVKPDALKELEVAIGVLNEKTPELKEFVLPGGSLASAHLHLARAIARRAERSVIAASAGYTIADGVVPYLNRLSSYLFAAALYLNFNEKIEEAHPRY